MIIRCPLCDTIMDAINSALISHDPMLQCPYCDHEFENPVNGADEQGSDAFFNDRENMDGIEERE